MKNTRANSNSTNIKCIQKITEITYNTAKLYNLTNHLFKFTTPCTNLHMHCPNLQTFYRNILHSSYLAETSSMPGWVTHKITNTPDVLKLTLQNLPTGGKVFMDTVSSVPSKELEPVGQTFWLGSVWHFDRAGVTAHWDTPDSPLSKNRLGAN